LPRAPGVWRRSDVRAAHTLVALLAALILQPAMSRAQDSVAPTTPAPAAPCIPLDVAGLSSGTVALLTRASLDPIIGCVAVDALHNSGDFTVAALDTVRGNIVVLDGTLRVAGTVTGSAVAINGAVIVDSSGHVLGDVISAEHGATIAAAGRIDGELRTLDAIEPLVTRPVTGGVADTLTSLKRTTAWFGIVILLGIGVLINAGDAMQRVNTALKSGFGRNVRIGIAAQLALFPVLVLLCVLLALTLVGILLIPFAIVAYVIAVLGLLVLGGLGAVQMVGSGIGARRPGVSERGARLQALVVGMLLLSVPCLIAAGFASQPMVAAAIGTLALGLTWIAVTAGLGAALVTRGGTRAHDEPWGVWRPAPSGAAMPVPQSQPEWLTPTPLTGGIAVKRKTTTGPGSAR